MIIQPLSGDITVTVSDTYLLASAMTAFSLGFEGFPETSIRGSTDDDSSDEESDAGDVLTEFDMGKLPTIAKDDDIVKRKLEKAKRQPVRNYLSLLFALPFSLLPNRRKIVVSCLSDGYHMGSSKTN